VVAGDTLRLHARAVDAAGRPIEGALILFQPAGGFFEAHIDSAGLVSSGAVGTLPVVVSAVAPGGKPVIERISVRMVPGPAARIEIAPRATRLLAGQHVRLDAASYSRAGEVTCVASMVGSMPRSACFLCEVSLHIFVKVAYLRCVIDSACVYVIDISNPSAPFIVDSFIVNARAVNHVMTTPDGNYMVIT